MVNQETKQDVKQVLRYVSMDRPLTVKVVDEVWAESIIGWNVADRETVSLLLGIGAGEAVEVRIARAAWMDALPGFVRATEELIGAAPDSGPF